MPFDNGNFEEVIRLAEEGEERDEANGLRGLVIQWKKYRFEAYQHTGQIESLRKLGEELVLGGEFAYYNKIKDTHPTEEWPPVYKNIVQKFEEKGGWYGDTYTQILLEEQDTATLLEYVAKKPDRIEEFYPYLKDRFPEQVKELFRAHIVAKAEQSSTRKQYWNVCRILRILQKVSGMEPAVEIVNMLLAKYPKRSAFRDELMKLNYR